MKLLSAAVVATVLSVLAALPAAAAGFVSDQAGMFSAATVAQLNERISNFNAQTGKSIVVVTTPTLGSATLQDAAATAFTQQGVNGVLIFIAKDDRRDIIVPGRVGMQSGWFAPDVLRQIRTAMEAQFKSGNYDAGVTGAVDALLNIYRAHLGGLRQASSSAAGAPLRPRTSPSQGVHISMFWWIIIIVVGFLLVRSIMRAAAPRYYGGGAPPPGAPPGAGYGPGYGYGGYGGGGSFWSGLLGGLGGAWLGNELFRGGGGAAAPADPGQIAPDAGGGWGQSDAGGWQSDAGQADMSGASGGDWSGGGFGGDFGGGSDFGGGGGDSGGGW